MHTVIPDRKTGFTIVELLVTIAIIATLAAILLPVINKAYAKSKSAALELELRNVEAAVEQYVQEYGRLPVHGTYQGVQDAVFSNTDNGTDFKDILHTLLGSNIAAIGNSKKLPFLDLGESGQDGTYIDPWGNPVRLMFDLNYDNTVVYNGVTNRSKVLVYSFGPDGQSSANPEDSTNQDDVMSVQKPE